MENGNIFMTDPTIWVLMSFSIFVITAIVFGRKIVFNILDEKIAGIRTQISNAEALRDEAQRLLMEYEAKQKTAAAEAQKILENAKLQAADLHRRAEKDLAETMDRRETMLKDRIRRMEDAAMDDIRRYAADLAISATKEIITQKLDQSSAQNLTDQAIRKVSGHLN